MKKILLTILLTALPACAFEDYMIISSVPVKSVSVENSEILQAQPLFTIDNQKKVIIVTPKSKGKTKINVNFFDGTKTLDVKVYENKTMIKPQEGFNYFLMDFPPQEPYIPLPPANLILPEPPKGGK
ncbi:hypothetical protein IJZ97_03915 [bacterium]|nr:hypothetical protein [bacterium]